MPALHDPSATLARCAGGVLAAQGRYRARLCRDAGDIAAAQTLRAAAFALPRPDRDRFDARCAHVLIEADDAPGPLACFRALPLAGGTGLARSYAAQFHDLARLSSYPKPMIEIGRFCVAPGRGEPDIPRMALAGMARLATIHGAGTLFGCTSFAGTDPCRYGDAFGLLAAHHRGPDRWRPEDGTTGAVPLAAMAEADWSRRHALRQMPPLLRLYLRLGGWVGDDVVIDREMNTLHVFTALEIAAMPAARRRRLLAIAGLPETAWPAERAR